MVAWANGKTVVVLGAGASRGAEFVNGDNASACKPPLNADFFTQLQRVTSPNLQVDIKNVIEDVLDLFGANFQLSLEEYFTLLQGLIEGKEFLLPNAKAKYSVASLKEKKRNLLYALSAVLEESADVTKAKSVAVKSRCGYHDLLVNALQPPDTIISFNYDCLIDHALRSSEQSVWSAKYGYGFKNASRVDDSSAKTWSNKIIPSGQNQTIRLLKLHGSLNWRELPSGNTDPIKFRQKIYKQNGQKTFQIIPPEFVKAVSNEPFQAIWSRAAGAIRNAETLIFIGFSFPLTDQLVEALFRISLVENSSLSKIIIVNPSKTDRSRIRQICSFPLANRKTRLIQFDSFAEFAPHAYELINMKTI